MAKNSTLFNTPLGIFLLLQASFASLLFIWFMLYGYVGDNPAVIFVSQIMVIMILVGLFASNSSKQLGQKATWGQVNFSYLLGNLVIFVMNIIPAFSFIKLQQNSLFSLIGGEVPTILQVLVTTVGASVSEELIWTVAIVTVFFASISVIFKKDSIIRNSWVSLILLSIILVPTFAYFHVGMVGSVSFLISAMIFRLILTSASIGDWKLNLIAFVSVYFPFNFGAHLMNNVMTIGISDWIAILSTHPFGIAFLFMWGWMLISGLKYALSKVGLFK